MSSTATPVSALANVLLDHEHPRQLDPGLEQDPRLRPRRSLRGLATLLVLSLVIHGLLIRFLPKWEHPIVDSASPTQGPLQVTMTPPSAADRAPPPVPSPTPTAPVKTPPRTVIAVNKPSPSMPPVVVPPDTPPTPSRAEATPQPLDFSAALEARRAQRQAQENFYAQQNAEARNGERASCAG